MGGEWGVGAALAFETLPAEGRGFFSGLLQEGYVCGNLLAALLYGLVFPHLHSGGSLAPWRMLFLLAAIPSLLVLVVLSGVKESPAWEAKQLVKQRAKQLAKQAGLHADTAKLSVVWKSVAQHLPAFLFLTLLMTAFMSFSHGTQDLYPTFLKHDHGLSAKTTSWVAIVGSLGALLGGICCGTISERFGRRRTMVAAALSRDPRSSRFGPGATPLCC